MRNLRSIRIILLTAILLFSLGQSGCSIFSSIGGWFSQGYDNTIAYFNAYYNAKRLFDEAEAEVIAAQMAAKGNPAQVPASTPKQKFALVIDKCSNILSFYPKSNVVDDALFLIGKSYFYQEDFVKAERKFTELLAQDPNGPLALDGQLWLLKTLQRLNKYDEAMRVGQDLSTSAVAADRRALAGEALSVLGDLALAHDKLDAAIDLYSRSVSTSDNGSAQAATQAKIGDLYYSTPDFAKAADSYVDVQKYSPDDRTLYYTQVQAAVSYRSIKRFEPALEILRKLEADYRFLDSRGTVRFELGTTLRESGKLEEAMDIYRLADTVHARTEGGARSSLELGKLYEFEYGNYKNAKTAFTHAMVGGPAELTKEAQRKVTAFDQYFNLQNQFFKLDSILYVLDVDSMWIMRDSSAFFAKKDTLLGARDSVRASPKVVLRPVPRPKKDSLMTALRIVSYQLGELFYSELDVPDSTFYWLNLSIKPIGVDSVKTGVALTDSTLISLNQPVKTGGMDSAKAGLRVHDSTSYSRRPRVKLGVDSVKAARALYVLAEVARASSDKKYGDEKDLYREILRKYPNSTYAEQARVGLGFPPTVKKGDPAVALYAVADSLMVVGKYKPAVDSLDRIVKDFSQSVLVPKARFAIAWIYETKLANPDSALVQYKALAEKFATTTYGVAALRRIPPPEAFLPVKNAASDSTRVLPDTSRRGRVGSVPPLPTDTTRGISRLLPLQADTLKKSALDSLKGAADKKVFPKD